MRSWWVAAAVTLLLLPAAAASAVDAPGPPMLVTAATTDDGTVVSWTPPLHDGGSPVLFYTVYRLDGAGLMQAVGTAPGDATSYVDALAGAAAYFVTASNQNAESAYSAPAMCVPVGFSIDGNAPFLHPGIDWDCIES